MGGEYDQLKEENKTLIEEDEQLKPYVSSKLEGEIEAWKYIFHQQKTDIEELKRINNEIKQENEILAKEREGIRQRALLRQFALNVEHECKCVADILNDEQLLELSIDMEDEYYFNEDIGKLRIGLLWRKLSENQKKIVWKGWFDDEPLNFVSLLDTLTTLKTTFKEEAHLVTNEGQSVTANDIKNFLSVHLQFTSVPNNTRAKRRNLRKPTIRSFIRSIFTAIHPSSCLLLPLHENVWLVAE